MEGLMVDALKVKVKYYTLCIKNKAVIVSA